MTEEIGEKEGERSRKRKEERREKEGQIREKETGDSRSCLAPGPCW